jgi:IS4 transposase
MAEFIVLLTNQFALSATTISAQYRHHWQIEIFFEWIKQHLYIKAFFSICPTR